MCMTRKTDKKKAVHRKFIAWLTAAAISVSAAAAASSVIVLAQETKMHREETTQEAETETEIGIETETEDAAVLITAVACDLTDFKEQVIACTEIAPGSEWEIEKEGQKPEAYGINEDMLKKIRLAEQEEVLLPYSYIDVKNEPSTAAFIIRLAESSLLYEQTLWSFCKSLGYTDAGAAAVLGNLAMESGLNPAARSANFDCEAGCGGAGLAGWMSRGRFRGLMALAEANRVPWQELSLQMSYLQYELENTRKKVGDEMKVQTDVDYATDYFCIYYEGCIGRSASPSTDGISVINGEWYQGLAKRKALARAYYEKYAEK